MYLTLKLKSFLNYSWSNKHSNRKLAEPKWMIVKICSSNWVIVLFNFFFFPSSAKFHVFQPVKKWIIAGFHSRFWAARHLKMSLSVLGKCWGGNVLWHLSDIFKLIVSNKHNQDCVGVALSDLKQHKRRCYLVIRFFLKMSSDVNWGVENPSKKTKPKH